MPSKVYSAAVVGVEAFEVEIEVHAGWGNTDKIAVVGLPDTAVKESKDRVTSAICNSGLRWPYGQRITINLAPADVRKEGPSFDLPIAVGMLKLEENNRLPNLDAFCLTGELALSVQLRPVKGVLSIALEAKRRHRKTLIAAIRSWNQRVRRMAGSAQDSANSNLTSVRSKDNSTSNGQSKSPLRAGTIF